MFFCNRHIVPGIFSFLDCDLAIMINVNSGYISSAGIGGCNDCYCSGITRIRAISTC